MLKDLDEQRVIATRASLAELVAKAKAEGQGQAQVELKAPAPAPAPESTNLSIGTPNARGSDGNHYYHYERTYRPKVL